ncbi:MAG: hypothetical protein JXR65_04675 [Bacteroidales bacterium]|nr:hypothetical protein [Bacteroidales bacterium]
MKKTFILFLMFSIAIIASGQNSEKNEVSVNLKKAYAQWSPDTTNSKKQQKAISYNLSAKPAYFVNNVLINEATLKTIQPDQIANINVIRGSYKINDKIYNGRVYIELKKGSLLKTEQLDLSSAPTKITPPEKVKSAVYVNNILLDQSVLKLIKPDEIDHISVLKGNCIINGKVYEEKVYIELKKNSTFFSRYNGKQKI